MALLYLSEVSFFASGYIGLFMSVHVPFTSFIVSKYPASWALIVVVDSAVLQELKVSEK